MDYLELLSDALLGLVIKTNVPSVYTFLPWDPEDKLGNEGVFNIS